MSPYGSFTRNHAVHLVFHRVGHLAGYRVAHLRFLKEIVIFLLLLIMKTVILTIVNEI